MSRSFGDYHFKKQTIFNQIEQIVIAKPDIYVYERLNEKDEFLILASDGIWDVITNEEIQHYINYRLKMTQNLAEICEDIVNACVEKVFVIFIIKQL